MVSEAHFAVMAQQIQRVNAIQSSNPLCESVSIFYLHLQNPLSSVLSDIAAADLCVAAELLDTCQQVFLIHAGFAGYHQQQGGPEGGQ